MSKLTRRDTLQLGAGALAGATLLRPRWTGAQNSRSRTSPRRSSASRTAPACACCGRPSSSQGDETVFLENTKKFTEKTGVEVTVD